jgi:O-antigen ligase
VSYSRGSVIAAVGGILWLLTITLIGRFNRSSRQGHTIIVVVLVLMFTGFGALGLKAFNAERTVDRFKLLLEDNNATWALRQITTDATNEMWTERPLYGWGAGGFRFLFPKFQQTRPEILWNDQRRKRGYLFWEYAHNDWIQISAEVGFVGLGLIGLGVVTSLFGWFRRSGWKHPLSIICIGGCITTIGHSRAEFLFYNPAIAMLWMCCATLALLAPALGPGSKS